MNRKGVDDLRSNRWFKQDDLRSFGHRSRVKQMGYWGEEFVGKPVIAIINTWNDLNTCHSHFPERVKDIKRGITAAGGFAVELPAMSLGEQLMKPSAMMYRNMLAMEVEELLRSYPAHDHAGRTHGRDLHESADHLCAGRRHAAWQLPWSGIGERYGCLEVLG
jgi:dihydroxy-acid dehydratase